MKTIETVSIWSNGQIDQAKVLNTYAINVTLNTSATFWYGLLAETVEGNISTTLAQGNLTMTGEAYAQWTVDSYAWDFVAAQLNLTITGDYVPPVPSTTTSTTITEVPLNSILADLRKDAPIETTTTTTTTI
jgi:hypothetical protein